METKTKPNKTKFWFVVFTLPKCFKRLIQDFYKTGDNLVSDKSLLFLTSHKVTEIKVFPVRAVSWLNLDSERHVYKKIMCVGRLIILWILTVQKHLAHILYSYFQPNECNFLKIFGSNSCCIFFFLVIFYLLQILAPEMSHWAEAHCPTRGWAQKEAGRSESNLWLWVANLSSLFTAEVLVLRTKHLLLEKVIFFLNSKYLI